MYGGDVRRDISWPSAVGSEATITQRVVKVLEDIIIKPINPEFPNGMWMHAIPQFPTPAHPGEFKGK